MMIGNKKQAKRRENFSPSIDLHKKVCYNIFIIYILVRYNLNSRSKTLEISSGGKNGNKVRMWESFFYGECGGQWCLYALYCGKVPYLFRIQRIQPSTEHPWQDADGEQPVQYPSA